MADKLNKNYGNARIAAPKSTLTRFEPGSNWEAGAKLRSARFYTTYNKGSRPDDTTKPEKK